MYVEPVCSRDQSGISRGQSGVGRGQSGVSKGQGGVDRVKVELAVFIALRVEHFYWKTLNNAHLH